MLQHTISPVSPIRAARNFRALDMLSLVLIAAYIVLLARLAAQGLLLVDKTGAPVRADFSVFWGSARLIAGGHAADAYDWARVRAALEAATGKPFPKGDFPFFYPPVMLLYIAPLGALPYFPAALAWIGATGAAYLAAARTILRSRTALLVALASPAVLWCASIGQNGLLSAALIAGGVALLERRPLAAGLLFAALTFKPQLGLLIPLALIAGGYWRALASAIVSTLALSVIAGLVLGFETYAQFIAASAKAQHALLVAGGLPWFKMQSFYGAARFAGLSAQAASLVQLCVTGAAAAGVFALWRSRTRFALKASGLLAGALAASPYACIYDYPMGALAILFLIADSQVSPFPSWQRAAAMGAFIMPFLFWYVSAPVGIAAHLLLAAVIAARALDGRASVTSDAARQETMLAPQ